MTLIWSYILVALCITMTSAGVIDSPGNRNDLHGYVKEEKVGTPPFNDGLDIDSDGYPGNSNENVKTNSNCAELCARGEPGDCLCQVPHFLIEVFKAMKNPKNGSNEYEIIPFDKEDILNLKNSDLCKTMCDNGVEKPPCTCD